MPPSIVEAARALDRALRRTFLEANQGVLTYDLTAAVIEAAREILDTDECTVAELNDMFMLDWHEPEWSVPLNDPPEAIGMIARNLSSDLLLLDLLRKRTVATDCRYLASTPEGTATMMSNDGIALMEFTIDDGVYFFLLAESDICEVEWWYAHGVADLLSRASAIENALGAIGPTEDSDDE